MIVVISVQYRTYIVWTIRHGVADHLYLSKPLFSWLCFFFFHLPFHTFRAIGQKPWNSLLFNALLGANAAMCTLFLNFFVFVVSRQCMGNRQSLLLEFKNNLTFDLAISKKLVKWNQSADCCSWEGVICNEGLVIGLNLSSESILGELKNSSSLFSLQHLGWTWVWLITTSTRSSQIPSKFGKLANLSYLNLKRMQFH